MENSLKNTEFMLSDLRPGQSARILSLKQVPASFRQRLMSMGITQGVVMTLVRRAPLGCPLEFECGHTLLCVRAHEVAAIQAILLSETCHA